MTTIFDDIRQLTDDIDRLNQIIEGEENQTVSMASGKIKPTISKAIFDQFEAIKASVQGRIAFQSKVEMDSDLNYSENTLAQVWNDVVQENNGLYGKLGAEGTGSWEKSPYDDVESLRQDLDALSISVSLILVRVQGYYSGNTDFVDSDGREISFALADEALKVALAILKGGVVNISTALQLKSKYLIEDDNGDFGLSKDLLETLVGLRGDGSPFILNCDFKLLEDPQRAYAIGDDKGNIAFSIKKDGGIQLGSLEQDRTNEFSWALVDKNRKVALAVTQSGELIFKPNSSTIENLKVWLGIEGSSPNLNPPLITELTHIQFHGQSLSLGSGGGDISGESSQGVLMPDSGLLDGLTGEGIDGLGGLPIQSISYTLLDGSYGTEGKEPPVIGACEQLQYMLDNYFGSSKTTVFGSMSGHGGYPIRYLDKEGDISVGIPSPNYELLRDQQPHYEGMFQSEGKQLSTHALCWVQGETDISQGTSAIEYKRRLKNLIYDYKEDTNQNSFPYLVTYQVGSHTRRTPYHEPDIPLAQWELSKEEPLVKMACPTYVFPYSTDGVHMTSHSYRWMGSYFGKALFNLMIHGEHRPLEPEYFTRAGRIITLKLHVPVPPLVIDTTLVSDPGDYGFKVFEGESELTIESVTLGATSDTIKLVLQDEPSSPVVLGYALGETGWYGGPTSGARGNIRDSDSTSNYFQPTPGYDYSLYNWCVMFKLQENQ